MYSPEWIAAQEQVTRWCVDAGLEASRDAVGNVWGRLRGTDGGPSIVSGSHVDSQTPGGRFDGALGVIGAVLALRALSEQSGAPRRTLEAVSLVEEEAPRFPSANMWGARAIVGQIEPGEAEAIRDHRGQPIGQAMKAVGFDPLFIQSARRDDIEAFLELHIEQGPVLEDAGLAVGLVSAITGVRHYVVEIVGRTDHAGARPMDRRLDAMACAAEIVTGVIGTANEMGLPAATTIGRLEVVPNLPAAVPGKVELTIDTRHPDPSARQILYSRQEALMETISARRGLRVRWKTTLDVEPCVSDENLIRLLGEVAQAQGVPSMIMHSGAAHDTQRMSRIAKVAMIFVRSEDGRSHAPEEFTTVEDATAGIQILAETLHRLAY